jgi:hypothetical protein
MNSVPESEGKPTHYWVGFSLAILRFVRQFGVPGCAPDLRGGASAALFASCSSSSALGMRKSPRMTNAKRSDGLRFGGMLGMSIGVLYMEKVIDEIKPGEVVAAIHPAYLEFREYVRLVRAAKDYLSQHEAVQQIVNSLPNA